MIVEFTAGVIGPQMPKHLEKKEEDKSIFPKEEDESIFPKETWQEKMSKVKISFPIESFLKLSCVSSAASDEDLQSMLSLAGR